MAPMPHLDAIGLRYGTDKASTQHNYLSFYESFFAPLRYNNISILEVGVLGGASLRTWKEYFPNAKIVGADIDPLTKHFEDDRIVIELLDQSNVEELTQVAIKHGPFDIIIEDGSHFWEHQITSLRTLFPFLRDGGYYVVEDLHTNFGGLQANYKGIANSSCVEYLKLLVDLRVAGEQINISEIEDAFLRTYGQKIQFITFYRHACLIKKQYPSTIRELSAGRPLATRQTGATSMAVHIIAHLSDKGDIAGPSGFVNLDFNEFSIQGFSARAPVDILQYRVFRRNQQRWDDWHDSESFAGTRGQSMPIIGFTIRLKESVKDHYFLRAFGRFADSAEPVEVTNSQDCLSENNAPLCGLQVEIWSRMLNY